MLWLAPLVALVGVVLRVRAYAANRSLWLDEAQLALNILRRSPGELLEPLAHNQAAPGGFLLLEKLAVDAFGDGEAALRLVPLLASLVALPVLHRVARYSLGRLEALFALGLTALSGPLIHYATEVKQYSTDVLVAVTILWTVAAFLERPRALGGLVLAAVGVTGVWISHTAAFTCAAAGLVLVVSSWNRGLRVRALALAAIASWLVSFLVHYALVIGRLRTGYLTSFWAQGFPACPPRSLSELSWWPQTLMGIFSDPAGLPFSGIAATAAGLGCLRLFRIEARQLALLITPALCALAAASLRLYPFPTSGAADTHPLAGRVILFLVPSLYILTAAGLGALWRSADGAARAAGRMMAFLLLAGMGAGAARTFAVPEAINELRGLVETISKLGHAEDVIVVSEKARPTLDYYIDRERRSRPLLGGLPVVELRGKGQWAEFRQQLQRITAPRVWLVYGHHPAWRSRPDEEFVRSLLKKRGGLLMEREATGASLHLFKITARGLEDARPDGTAQASRGSRPRSSASRRSWDAWPAGR